MGAYPLALAGLLGTLFPSIVLAHENCTLPTSNSTVVASIATVLSQFPDVSWALSLYIHFFLSLFYCV